MKDVNLKNKISKKGIIVDITYIVATAIISLFMFLPIYKDRATLLGIDEDGNEVVSQFLYDKTPLERLEAINIEWLLYFGLSLFFICIILGIISYATKYKISKYKRVGFMISLGFMIILLLIASVQMTMY